MFKYLLTFILLATQAQAAELQGFVALESRVFLNDARYPQQDDEFQGSVVIEPEYFHVSDDEQHIFTFRPFFRLDSMDDERTHFDIRDLNYLYSQDDWEVKVGASTVFWGVTESRHLVDIINQYDTVEDTDEEDKLGQPMVQFSTFQDWGTMRFFYLPYHRERTFPGTEGRLRGPLVVSDSTFYESDAGQWYPSFATRYEKVAGDFDIGISNFNGVAREPRFVLNGNRFDPYYDTINQIGLDLQYTTDSTLWKLEAINRTGHVGGSIQAVSGGLEYTFYQIFESDKDLGLLAEYHYDNRGVLAPETIFDNDLFVGGRLTWNDADDTALLAGALVDTQYGQLGYSAEFETRLNNRFKLEIESRLNSNMDAGLPENVFNRDDFVQVRLARYF